MAEKLKQLTKAQIKEQLIGKDGIRYLIRLSILGRQQKVIRTEEMALYLEWTAQSTLRAITTADFDWPEGDEESITEEGNIVVGNHLMQLFAPNGAGAPLLTPERVEEMSVYRVGELYTPTRTSWPEAGEYNYRKNTHELRLFSSNLSLGDIEAIRRGPARFGLLVKGDIIFFLYEFGKAYPLSDASYTIHMVPKEEQTLPPLPDQLAPTQGVSLNVILVDADNGKIAALRLIGLGHEFSIKLIEAIHLQKAHPFSQASYDIQLNAAYQQYPQTRDMWKDAIHFDVPERRL